MLYTASILVMPCWQLYYCTLISVHPLHSISWNVAVLQKKPRTLPSLETICLWSMNYGLGKGVVWTCCCFFNPYTQRIDCDQGCDREFKQWWQQRQWRKRQKNQYVKSSKTMTLHVRHIFLYIFLPSTKMWKCLISRLWRTRTQENAFLFLNLNFDTVC